MDCRFNCAGPYIHKLMNLSDILILNEHGLYNCEMYKINEIHQTYRGFGKASHRLNDTLHGKVLGHGGCAILWHDYINSNIEPMPHLGSDRVCVLKVNSDSDEVYVIAVYLNLKVV